MDEETKITLRLPKDLHRWLTAQAKSARRSLNSEIVYRLEVGRGTVVADAESPGGDSPSPALLRRRSDSSPT